MHNAPSHWSHRFPRQFQRAVPVAVACLLLMFFLLIGPGSPTSFSSSTSSSLGHFPRKIWQTWKVDPLGFEERDLTRARTWVAKNPGHRYEVLTDQNDIGYVEFHFGPNGLNRPDIVHLYKSISAKIIKADLLRYMVMYVEGGVYTDIDVEALRPIDRFIPDRYHPADIDMVIGVEIDQPFFHNHHILGKKSQSFCQWTFMCKPRLPVMLQLIENIMRWLNDVAARQRVPISDVVLDFDDVIIGTGPSAFTGAILAEMSRRAGRQITWSFFHNMAESKLVGGVLVLPVDAFAAGQGHSDSGNHEARAALVRHHYHASGWPTNHVRFKHPVYGEVEKCNWKPECVAEWDRNTAAFDSLPVEERQKQVALHQVNAQREEAGVKGGADVVANPPM